MTEKIRIPSDGLELAVEIFGDGPPLIFGHGLLSSRGFSRVQLGNLADRYRLILFDQRGHNDSSPVTDEAMYDSRRMAGDITAILDALDIQKAIVGGESMGAAVATQFALNSPERVEALLLTAPSFGDQLNSSAGDIRAMGHTIREDGLIAYLTTARERRLNEYGWPPEMVDYLHYLHGSHAGPSLAAACLAVIEWTLFPDLSVLGSLTMPACLVAWDGDPLHPLTLAERYAATLPDARLEELPSFVDLFLHPEQVGEIYARFLTRERV